MVEEVANALLTGVQRNRWNGASADPILRTLRRPPVHIVETPGDLGRARDL
jgi:hypothetical protein